MMSYHYKSKSLKYLILEFYSLPLTLYVKKHPKHSLIETMQSLIPFHGQNTFRDIVIGYSHVIAKTWLNGQALEFPKLST